MADENDFLKGWSAIRACFEIGHELTQDIGCHLDRNQFGQGVIALSVSQAIIAKGGIACLSHILNIGIIPCLAGWTGEIPVNMPIRSPMYKQLHGISRSLLITEPGRYMIGCETEH